MGKEENGVQQDLIAYAREMMDVLAIRINSGRVKVKGGWLTLAPAGTPDMLFVLFGGRCCWLEAKTPIGKLSAEQARTHAELRRRGHVVIVASSRAEFLAGMAAYDQAPDPKPAPQPRPGTLFDLLDACPPTRRRPTRKTEKI